MKSITKAGSRWRTIMVLTPLVLLVILAIAASGSISAGSAQYVYSSDHLAPNGSYGVSNDLLWVANGRASDVKVIDVGTMSIVDSIPVPNEATPGWLHDLNPGFMNWEVHAVAPAQDRKSVYAGGALSGGSYSIPGDPTSTFRLADYELYQIDVATKSLIREIPLQGPGSSVNAAGVCGAEYNLNDESSNELILGNMNASNATLLPVLGIDLGGVRGTGASETGGWTSVNVATGTYAGYVSMDNNGNQESSTCGIAWDASGTRGFASQMFEPLVDTVNWSTRATDGSIASTPGASYHQEASDKARDILYVTNEAGAVDMFDMSTNTLIGQIDINALMGSGTSAPHGVELSPNNSNVIYVTARQTPDVTNNMELAIDVTDVNSPVLIGAVSGLAQSVCGVYADADKSLYYAAADPTGLGDEMLFVANGRASDVKVIDVGTMSIVDSIPVPNEATPGWLHDLNPGFMNWEIHSVAVGANDGYGRTNIYAGGALSGGSYSIPGDPTSEFRLADYELYDINTATKTLNREIPLQGPGSSVNAAGVCGAEYNLNDESSNELILGNMNASNATLLPVLGIDLGGVRGTGASETGGWTSVNVATGTYAGYVSMDNNGNQESSTCGIAWDASGTRGFASQMFEPLVDTVNWSTRATDGSIASTPGASYHQEASDKARDILYVTNEAGAVDMFDMSTNTLIGQIDINALTGSLVTAPHGVELAPGNSNIIYVTSRQTPDAAHNMELVIDVTDINAPVLKGSIPGLAQSVCGVYAIADKAEYYGTKPGLSLSKTGAFWASYADFTARKLSVSYSIGNTGAAGAADVAIVGSTSTVGVTTASAMPLSAGNIAAGGSTSVTVQYNVPTGVGSFKTSTYATAQNGASVYSYPGPYPGA